MECAVHGVVQGDQGAAELRLICNLTNINPDWTLRHVSAAMRGAGAEQLQAVVRTAVESRVGPNALQFFASLGFIADFEFLQEGVVYTLMRGNHTLSIAVSSLHKLMRAQDVSSATPLSPGSWLVEVTVPATSDTYTDAVAAIVTLGDQLYPQLRAVLALPPAWLPCDGRPRPLPAWRDDSNHCCVMEREQHFVASSGMLKACCKDIWVNLYSRHAKWRHINSHIGGFKTMAEDSKTKPHFINFWSHHR
eukprot:jgi/Chlat1/285/Chrsp1S03175